MSTKTSFKRIALVAVTALGAGVLSVAPANAASNNNTIVPNNSVGTINLTAPTAPTVGAAAAFTVGVTTLAAIVGGTTDTFKIKAVITSAPTGGISSFTGAVAASGLTAEQIDVSSGAGVLSVGADGTTGFPVGTHTLGTLSFTPAKVGTYNISIWHDQSADGTLSAGEKYQTATITVGAANGYSNAVSTIYSNKLSTTAAASAATAATNTTPKAAKAMSATRAGTISISLNTATNTSAHTFVSKVEAITSGAGYVDVVNAATPSANSCYANAAASPLRSDSITSPSQQVVTVYVCADGTAGTGSVTIKVTDTDGVVYTLGSVATLYTDAAKSLELVKTNYTIAPASGGNIGEYTTMGTRDTAAKIPASILVTKDDAKNAVTHTNTPAGLSSNTAVLTGGTCAVDDGNVTYGSGGAGYWNCYVTAASSAKSGDTATITWRVLNADGVTYTTVAPVTYTIGGVIAKAVMALNKTSYAPGEAMTLTVTVTDAAGKPAYDGQAVLAATATSNMTINTLPGTTLLSVGGVGTTTANTLFAPSVAGGFTIFGVGSDAAATKISATSTVGESAGVAALTTLINSLVAKINALNKLVIKIQKKVRA